MSVADKRAPLIGLLERYRGVDAAEEDMRQAMLAFVRRAPDCFERALEEGHMTGSAWIVNPERTQAVMMHHRKLDLWLQPGGHADGNPDLLEVARTEVNEETGLTPRMVSPEIFDVDIHEIPANSKTPAHLHYDVRFLFEVPADTELQLNPESKALAWIPLTEVKNYNSDVSVVRLANKSDQSSIR